MTFKFTFLHRDVRGAMSQSTETVRGETEQEARVAFFKRKPLSVRLITVEAA